MCILKVKVIIDFLMTLLLILLMTYQVTGEVLHEWLGVGMLALFLIHNLLNIRWYGNLKKGKYKFIRIFQTIINFALLTCMLCLAYSGMILSRHVFSFLPVTRGMALARVMHLVCSYWGMVLMSIHLGLHWKMAVGMFGRLSGRKSQGFIWRMRLFAGLFAGYGAICFYQADILSYMFLKAEFAFLDYEKSAILILLEYVAMMGFWVFTVYHGGKVVERHSQHRKSLQRNGEANE